MRIAFGKHRGALLERILLTDPGYIEWMLNVQKRDRKFQELCQEACRLVNLFDRKPLQKECCNDGCGKQATRLSITDGGYELNYWCDECRPRSVKNYGEAVDVVHNYLSALYLEMKHPVEYFQLGTPLLALAYAKGFKMSPRDLGLEAFYRDQMPKPSSMLGNRVQGVW